MADSRRSLACDPITIASDLLGLSPFPFKGIPPVEFIEIFADGRQRSVVAQSDVKLRILRVL